MQRTFKSKIGIFVYILLLISIILLFYSMWIKCVAFLVVMLIINVLFVPSFIHTEYIIIGDMLYLKSGYLPTLKIDICAINAISRPKSFPFFPLRGYALSKECIIIYYNNKKYVVSPYDQKGFINELMKHNADIKTEKM